MKTSVVIGRFQIDTLHEGHFYLIQKAHKEGDKLVILVGEAAVPLTNKNPLSFEQRWAMLQHFYPHADIRLVEDHPSDAVWSSNVDALLIGYENPTLYGSRDSFIPYYSGTYPTVQIDMPPTLQGLSSTKRREELSEQMMLNRDFRHGVIYAVENRYPTVYPTVDIAVLKAIRKGDCSSPVSKTELLLGRKAGQEKYVFIGGFIDPADFSPREAAWRELHEEVKNMDTHELTYVDSIKIHDWRYRGTKDSIMTNLFVTYFMGGNPQPADDIAELKWFDVNGFDEEVLAEHHRPLYRLLKLKKYA